MSDGEEGVLGSLLLTVLSLLRSRQWRSEFLDLSRCLLDIFADSWRECSRESDGRGSRSFLEDAGFGAGRSWSRSSFDSLL